MKEKLGSTYSCMCPFLSRKQASPEFCPVDLCLHLGPEDKKKLKRHIFDFVISVVGGIIVEKYDSSQRE